MLGPEAKIGYHNIVQYVILQDSQILRIGNTWEINWPRGSVIHPALLLTANAGLCFNTTDGKILPPCKTIPSIQQSPPTSNYWTVTPHITPSSRQHTWFTFHIYLTTPYMRFCGQRQEQNPEIQVPRHCVNLRYLTGCLQYNGVRAASAYAPVCQELPASIAWFGWILAVVDRKSFLGLTKKWPWLIGNQADGPSDHLECQPKQLGLETSLTSGTTV